jgi:hypothetical protein
MRPPLLACILAVSACTPAGAPENEGDDLKTRAAFELGCPKAEIKVVTLDARTKGVTGCGMKAVYVEHCQRPGAPLDEECTWVNNTSARAADKCVEGARVDGCALARTATGIQAPAGGECAGR